jgi:hypothetical protein
MLKTSDQWSELTRPKLERKKEREETEAKERWKKQREIESKKDQDILMYDLGFSELLLWRVLIISNVTPCSLLEVNRRRLSSSWLHGVMSQNIELFKKL